MKRVNLSVFCILVLTLTAALVLVPAAALQGQQNARNTSPTGFITGVVRGARGPEAGVWVIAETKDLLTNFIKIVVTDDQEIGRAHV